MPNLDKFIQLSKSVLSKIAGVNISNLDSIMGLEISPGVPPVGDRGVFGGGYATSNSNVLDYITISSPSNAADFGDLPTVNHRNNGSTSNAGSGRGIFAGHGRTSGWGDSISYITIETLNSADDFGDLTVARGNVEATSNNSNNRGVFAGGGWSFAGSCVIDYITISTTGDATDFGTLNGPWMGEMGASNGINDRGLFAGKSHGDLGGNPNSIDYITISTTGNATDFGDMIIKRGWRAGCDNSTSDRAVWAGGSNGGNPYNNMDYVTISTTSNASDFGDLSPDWRMGESSGCSNGTNDRGIFGGGKHWGSATNNIYYITISTTGNSTNFGDLTVKRYGLGACANA